jgi:hypothetical protein
MGPGADVRSIESLRDAKVALIEFQEESREALGMAAAEIQRMETWLADCIRSWARQLQGLEDRMHIIKMEISRKEIPDVFGRIPDTSELQDELNQLKRRYALVMDRIEVSRQWQVRLPRLIDEAYLPPAHRLRNYLDLDLESAIVFLEQRRDSLEKYLQAPGV